MSLIDTIKKAKKCKLTTDSKVAVEFELFSGMNEEAVSTLELSLSYKFPGEFRYLLYYCSGFRMSDGIVDQVDFTGKKIMFEFDAVFSNAIPLAADWFGNFWIVDLSTKSLEFAPVWFVCHDAPVVLYQSTNLKNFLTELFKLYRPPYTSIVKGVHGDDVCDVWTTNPNVLDYNDCIDSSDSLLHEFAVVLDSSYEIIDLRDAKPGEGFSWGRYGSGTVVKRFKNHPVFAYQRKKGFLQRLFGK